MSLRATPSALSKRYVRPASVEDSWTDIEGRVAPQIVVVPVRATPTAGRLRCFYNVRDHVVDHGGAIVFGWAVWVWPNVNVELIHHAVWKDPNGDLIDITPPELCYHEVAFIVDSEATFDFDDILENARPKDTRWLSSVPAVAAYRAAYDEHARLDDVLGEYLKKSSPSWKAVIASKDATRTAVLEALAQACSASDPCFCGSSQTFDHCCSVNFVG